MELTRSAPPPPQRGKYGWSSMQHGEWYCVLRTEPGALGQDAHADKIRHAAYNWAARQGLRAETRSAARGAELYVRFMAKGGAVRGPR